jgi:uncharacterized phage infection (PIP) family protein YhgE
MKNFVNFVRSMLSKKACLNVFAEEEIKTEEIVKKGEEIETPPATNTNNNPKPTGTVNFEDLIAKARKEEKEKLYPEITALKEKNNQLLLVVQERDNKIAEITGNLDKVSEDFKKASKDLKTGNASNSKVSELTLQLSTLERQLEDLQVKYETDVNSLKLESYKEKKIAEANGAIIPELVTGNTEEEVNSSFESAKQRYSSLQDHFMAGVTMPSANPSQATISLTENVSLVDIQNMTTKQYAEYRKNLNI